MAGFSERQAVESLPRIKKEQRDLQTTDTYYKPQQPSDDQMKGTTRVVQGLLSLAETGNEVYQTRKQKKIELDKVTQTQRAIRGLDVSDGATAEGRRAYQVVQMRDETLDANAKLSQAIKENPDMTDEEYELMTREVYSGMLDKYKDDPQLATAASNKIQESQGQMHQIRVTAKAKHQEWKNMETLKKGITAYTEASESTEQLSQMLSDGGQLSNEADAIGVTPSKYREALKEQAVTAASTGDGRLLKAIEGKDWAQNDSRVNKAKDEYESWRIQENQEYIGATLGKIEKAYYEGGASWEQTLDRYAKLNDEFKGSATPSRIASAYKRGKKQLKQASERQIILQNHLKGKTPIGQRVDLTPGQKTKLTNDMTKLTVQQVDAAVASGDIKPENRQAAIGQNLLRLGREQEVSIPNIQGVLENAMNPSNADWISEHGEIPSDSRTGYIMLDMMNDQDMQRNLDASGRAWVERYRSKKETETGVPDIKAINFATRGDRNRGRQTLDDPDNMEKRTREAATKGFDTTIGEDISNFLTSPWRQDEKVVSPSKDLQRLVGDIAVANFYGDLKAGGGSPERVADTAGEMTFNKVTNTQQGLVVFRERTQLAEMMQQRYQQAGGEGQLSPSIIDSAFDEYAKGHIDDFRMASPTYDTELKLNDIAVNVSGTGLVRYRDANNSDLHGRTIPIIELIEYAQEVERQRKIDRADKPVDGSGRGGFGRFRGLEK